MIDYGKAKILLVNLYATRQYTSHLNETLRQLMTTGDYIDFVGPKFRDIYESFSMAGVHVDFVLDCLDQHLVIDANKLKLKHIPMEYHILQLQSISDSVEAHIESIEEFYPRSKGSRARIKSLRTTMYEYVEDYFNISTFRKIKWHT